MDAGMDAGIGGTIGYRLVLLQSQELQIHLSAVFLQQRGRVLKSGGEYPDPFRVVNEARSIYYLVCPELFRKERKMYYEVLRTLYIVYDSE